MVDMHHGLRVSALILTYIDRLAVAKIADGER